jgi:serine/threonine protein kinase
MFQTNQLLHDRYQLQRRLGNTAPGRQTWLAEDHQQANQVVVVKLLVFNPEFQWDNLKLFEREAQVLANLDHPQIPQYIDFFVADSTDQTTLHWWALVQEFVPGDSLQELIDRRYKFEPAAIHDIALDILEILIYLHELSPPVLHRDIKPSNLILGEDNKVYLIDFGAVQDEKKVTGMTFTVVGTVGYAPMEQFWGRSTPASDLYGLGATLIHLTTGIPPADLPQKDLRLQFADRMSSNVIAANWLSKMVEPAIEQRYQSARSAHKDLLNGSIKTAQLVRPESSSMNVAIKDGDLMIWPSNYTQVTNKRPKNTPIGSIAQRIVINSVILIVCLFTVVPFSIVISHIFFSSAPILLMLAFNASVMSLILAASQPAARRYGLRFSRRSFKIIPYRPTTIQGTVQAIEDKPLVTDLVSTIQSVFSVDVMASTAVPMPDHDYWQVVIQAKETHTLPWKLSKSESEWIIQEINDWLDRRY